MADADVPITSGAGTKIDTRTVGAGTDEHRQVVVVGDPTTAANVQAVSAAGAAKVDGSAVTQPMSATETLADNAAFTDGTSKLFTQGYIFDEVAGTALTENDVAAPRIDSKRAIVNVIEDAVNRGVRAAVIAAAEGMANAVGQVVNAQQAVFNGTTWDRLHGNWRTTTGDTGAKTVTFNGATQTNYDGPGAFIVCRVGTVSGTSPTMNIQLQISPDNGTTWLTMGPTTANVTATGSILAIAVGPTNWSQTPGPTPTALGMTGVTTSAFINAYLPRTWRVLYTIGGTTPSFNITATDVNYIGGA